MLVGITGGIGSGKSSLARLLVQRGAALVDADRLAHQVLEVPEVIAALVASFGPAITDSQGKVVRKELGRLAFASQEGFELLSRTVRPFLEDLLWREVAHAEGPERERVAVVDAALIFEWGVERRFDLIVVVDAGVPLRRRRAATRQGLSEEEVERRMAWQLPAAEKAARADLVISNEGTLAELERAAERVWDFIAEKKGTPGRRDDR